jgi:hypothetical protein
MRGTFFILMMWIIAALPEMLDGRLNIFRHPGLFT